MITKTIITGKESVLGIDKDMFVYRMARDFFDKGIAATNDLHRPKSLLTDKTHWMVCFPVCTIAFSLELALKNFLTDEQISKFRKKKSGHELLDLYELIDTEIQNKIEAHFDWCGSFKNKYFNMSYRPANYKDQHQNISSTKERITVALKKSNKAFLDFRYFYSLDPTQEYWFDFNTFVQFTHACLAIKAEELGIEYN